MKIAMFSKSACKMLKSTIEETLQEVAKEYGISIRIGSGGFDNSNFTFKVEASVISEDGQVMSKEVEEFKYYAKAFKLEPSDLGLPFSYKGEVYKIKGLSTRSLKFPILAIKERTGKVFKFPVDIVNKAFGRVVKPELTPELV